MIFSVPFDSGYEEVLGRFISPSRIVCAGNGRVAVFDLAKKEELWSRTFNEIWQAEIGQGVLWVAADGDLVALSLESGEEQNHPKFEGQVVSFSLVGESLFVTTNRNQMAVVDAASGRIVKESAFAPTEERFTEVGNLEKLRREYQPGMQIEIELIKEKMGERESMKPFEATAIKQEGLRVTDTMEVAQHLMNEARREVTGGVELVDESAYRVRLCRLEDKAADLWTGVVNGRPEFFALSTVNLLVAGQTLIVFDKQGKKLWESKLAYLIAPETIPAVETAGGLYFFDQGVLTAFDLGTGDVRWRLGSVGISQLQYDNAGMLYLTTTNANPETIRYSEQVDFSNPRQPMVLKVDPSSGKILWQVEKTANQCYVSGKFLYFTRTQAGFGGSHFRIFRADPNNGKTLWEYYSPEVPSGLDFRDNQILMLFPQRLDVMKYFTF